TDSFAGILSEARKYRLNLIIAHQYTGQLVTDTSTKVRDAVFGNVGTMIIFRVGAADAEFLESEFEPEFTPQDLVALPNRQIYLKLMVDGITSRPFSATTLPPFQVKSSLPEEIIQASRSRYGNPREKVEEDIIKWSGAMGGHQEGHPQGQRSGPPGQFRRPMGGDRDMRPQQDYRPRPQPAYNEDRSALSAIGIEFAPQETTAPSNDRPMPRPYPPKERPKFQEVSRAAAKPSSQPISLSDLKTEVPGTTTSARPKASPKVPTGDLSIDDLRKAITKSLGDSLKHPNG
ncbi:MAG: hypothetical protein AAB691_01420, partial [Patescibacteria group bacterium]